MKDSINIRRATLTDVSLIENCVKSAYSHYIKRIGKPPAPMLDDYKSMINKHDVFVAEANQILGLLVLMRTHKSMLLDNIAVHPDHQGQGLGRRLMEFAYVEAVNQGFDKIELYTNEIMHENIAIYTALGFVETERKVEKGFKRVYMQKDLSNHRFL